VNTNDRDELIALYTANLRRFRAAQGVLTTHGEGTSVPTRAELLTEEQARDRMLELRRVLWPGWTHH
jgi:hypothetical protein